MNHEGCSGLDLSGHCGPEALLLVGQPGISAADLTNQSSLHIGVPNPDLDVGHDLFGNGIHRPVAHVVRVCAAQVVAGTHDDVATCCFRDAGKGSRIAAKAFVGGIHDSASASSDEPL